MPRNGAPFVILSAIASGLLLLVLGLFLADRVAELPGRPLRRQAGRCRRSPPPSRPDGSRWSSGTT